MFNNRRKNRAFKRLKVKRWIEDRQIGNRVEFILRDDAVIKLLKLKIRATTKQQPKGTLTLVVFDFPEAARRARDAFRSTLKKLAFRKQQLSVWISERDVILELKHLIRLLGLEKWARVYRAQ